jgi:hypothetical protein
VSQDLFEALPGVLPLTALCECGGQRLVCEEKKLRLQPRGCPHSARRDLIDDLLEVRNGVFQVSLGESYFPVDLNPAAMISEGKSFK